MKASMNRTPDATDKLISEIEKGKATDAAAQAESAPETSDADSVRADEHEALKAELAALKAEVSRSKGRPVSIGAGPKKTAKGAYLPAAYRTRSGTLREDR